MFAYVKKWHERVIKEILMRKNTFAIGRWSEYFLTNQNNFSPYEQAVVYVKDYVFAGL